ncbi:hypothetical protein D3C76_1261300 [compost metagenome]
MVPVAAGVRHPEAVDEAFARLHRRLRDVGHAVHLDGQADAVPVDGGRLVQPVAEAYSQPVALAAAELHARGLSAVGQRGTLEARHQFQVERRGDQLVVMLGGHFRARQPDARASGAEAEHCQAGDAAEDLSAGETHGISNEGWK